MAKHYLFFILFVSATLRTIPQASALTCPNLPTRLFVFGDSYLDTGNSYPPYGPWAYPLGITLGKPTGRFSDGLVWTDYLASYMGLDTPTPFVRVNASDPAATRSGVNFAIGGAGLFPTLFMNVTMEVQMNQLRELIGSGVFDLRDLKNSAAFISISGNDYVTYTNSTFPFEKDIHAYSVAIVAQLAANLQILHTMGIGKIAVASLPPLGCLPENVRGSEYPGNCNETINENSRRHNDVLKVAVDFLNMANEQKSVEYVDFYGGFLAAMDQHLKTANKEYLNPTGRCCVGNGPRGCGEVDEAGKPKYTLCGRPLQSFFWDGAHPAQHGWQLVFEALREDIRKWLS